MAKFKKISLLSFLLGLTINLAFGAMKSPNVPGSSSSTAPTVTIQTNNGLKNLGDTCFMNATIQVLSNVGPLTEFLLKQDATDSAISAYIKLLKEFRTQGQGSIYPIDFRDQNLGTLNKNRLQNQIYTEVSEQTKPDRIKKEQLREAERQSIFNSLSIQDQQLIKTNPTSLKFDQVKSRDALLEKLNQQTSVQLKQKAEYQQHCKNIQKINLVNFSKYKNALVQYYGTEEMAKKFFNTSPQQDAAEFLGEMLDTIIEKTSVNRSNLQLKTIKQDTCRTCGKQTNPVGDTFSIFNLPIQNTTDLEHCLNSYMQTAEEIEKYCESDQCLGQNKIHTRTTKIQETPSLLTLQFIRFTRRIDPKTGEEITVKINAPIKFPLTLNLKNYLVQPTDAVYDLIGFVCHNGETANSGHYISYAKDYRNQNWYKYNDSMVEQKPLNFISHVETLGYLPTGRFKKDPFTLQNTNIDEGIDSTPYILFYQKREIPQETIPAPATTATTAAAAVTPMEIDTQEDELKRQQAREEALRLARQIMQQEQDALKKQQEEAAANERLKAAVEKNRALKAKLAALKEAKRRKLNQ